MNLILGGGDVGKTTILDAISLLLSPVNPANLADTEYHARQIEQGFSIEGIISLPPGCGINVQMKPAWPWGWNGSDAMVPDLDGAPNDAETPVYKIRVRGTDELELYYEIVQPDGTADAFPVALRRAIGLIRLGGDDRNDRDLRLVQGSALDRLLSDKALRSRMASELAGSNVKNQLDDQAKDELVKLDAAFRHKNLPSGLDLQITGGQGASIASMVGLTAHRYGVALPLSSWGAGTRRLAALAITEQNQSETPITVVDEIARRHRRLDTAHTQGPCAARGACGPACRSPSDGRSRHGCPLSDDNLRRTSGFQWRPACRGDGLTPARLPDADFRRSHAAHLQGGSEVGCVRDLRLDHAAPGSRCVRVARDAASLERRLLGAGTMDARSARDVKGGRPDRSDRRFAAQR